MDAQTSVPLARLTTFHIGGPATALIHADTQEDISTALDYARESGLPLYVLGAGSNLLVPDEGVHGVVLHMRMSDMAMEDDGEQILLIAGAGAMWEDIVDAACASDLYGIENLAGIPGTLGGAVVQNIGAYGAELAPVFAYAEVVDSATGKESRITREEALFAYRSSLFKKHPELIIVRVALALAKRAPLQTAYADLVRAREAGTPLTTPKEVAHAVRGIRARKFPTPAEGGTAGSFFKNPVITEEVAVALAERYPGLPTFPQGEGMVKVPLAWILDHALALKGYAKGPVRLYEKQPLVIVAESGARAEDVDALASEIHARVFDATNIIIEREVETFGAR